MAAFDSDALHRFLTINLSGSDFQLESIKTCGTNQHFCVHADKDYFLKVFVTNSLQVVNRQQQFRIQAQLAKQNLAPNPLALSDCQQFWLEEWCAIELLREHPDLNNSDVSEQLANAMSAIHQCSVDAPVLDLEAEWLRYLDVAKENHAKYIDKIESLLRDYNQESSLCFCHNDLHSSHILSATPLRVVDWEYSALGNRYFDLAACVMVNELKPLQISRFIDQYALNSGVENAKVTAGVQLMLPVVDFTNKLWHNAYNQITQF